jgi:hypothetical protein
VRTRVLHRHTDRVFHSRFPSAPVRLCTPVCVTVKARAYEGDVRGSLIIEPRPG